MRSPKVVFEVHYGGRFDMGFGCEHVGGQDAVHKHSFDPDELSYFELESIYKEYGYRSGDLMYFKDLVKSLVDGLNLITSNHDRLFLCACHTGHFLVHLYIVSFGDGGGD
jgi:hypothetical protein